MKVILPAGEIPIGATVTKRTGDAQYTLISMIKVYDQMKVINSITAPDGLRMIVNSSGVANIITNDTELCWVTNKEDFYHYLQDLLEENK